MDIDINQNGGAVITEQWESNINYSDNLTEIQI